MSPSEFQLRAALHDGEGDSPDPNRVIAHALGVRRERRHRINTVLAGAGAVIVVGGCATAIALARGDGSSGGSKADDAARPPAGAAAGAAGTSAGPAASSAAASSQAGGAHRGSIGGLDRASSRAAGPTFGAAAIGCPTVPDRFMTPGGGGIGKFGSTDPLLDTSVTSLRVCGYPEQAAATRTSTMVSGATARAVVAKLNAAPAVSPQGRMCPDNTSVSGGTIELFGVTASGSKVEPVVITLGCPASKATNGTAVRYVTELPEQLSGLAGPQSSKSTAGRPTR